jgi:hypothetical protein
MRWYADWLRHQMDKLGVDVRYRSAPTPDELKAFDAVILATGGRVTRPAIPGIDLPLVSTFEDVLRCGMDGCQYYPADKPPALDCGSDVLVWGDHFGAADSAEKLAADGKRVFVVTERSEFASWMEPCHRDVLLKRFAGGNGEGLPDKPFAHAVTVIPRSTVVEIAADGSVTLMDQQFRKSCLKISNVVLAAVEPDDGLCEPLLAAGLVAMKIGDARQVRNLRSAVAEGANAGLTLDRSLALNANRTMISRLPTEVEASV